MELAASRDALAPAPRRNLPARILRAIDDALHLSGLSKSLRPTLAALCRFVSQADPFATIFAKKETIAERLGVDVRTVLRHLAALESNGLIERLDQERKSRNGRFAVSRIRLTRKAAELVGLVAPEADVIHTPPDDNLSPGHTLTEPTISKNQPQRIENGLPVDLAWLTGNGVSRAGIFALMRKATMHGKRLSDIVLVVRDYIRDLKGGRLFAYLNRLASGPTCFAVAAATERQRIASQAEARTMERKITAFKVRFAGATLTNRQQSRLYQIDRSAKFAQVFGGAYPVTVPLNDLREWVQRVESGELVLATLATERRLMA